MRYLHCFGFPFSLRFMVEIAIVGMALSMVFAAGDIHPR